MPLGPSTKVASVRLNVTPVITSLALSEHFSAYLFIKEQASRPQFNRERLQQNGTEMNYREKPESQLRASSYTALPLKSLSGVVRWLSGQGRQQTNLKT